MFLVDIFKNSLMISVFVFVMMLLVEYINIYSQGNWQKKLSENKWGQYIFCALLGAIPGCLGTFAVVTMYSHRIVTLGALTAAMIATSGDESFVMLAMFPKKALFLTVILFIVGIMAGVITDLFCKKKNCIDFCPEAIIKHQKEVCAPIPLKKIYEQLKNCSLSRGLLIIFLLSSFVLFITGTIGEEGFGWEKITILVLLAACLIIVLSSPDHFLEKHLWEHVVKKHIPRIFFWTFVALVAVHLITEKLYLDEFIKNGKWFVFLSAGLTGIIPDSGPHLIFVSMFAKGIIPFSILITNSIIQDGHGMLPVLGFSRKVFFIVKGINLLVGLIIGASLLLLGF